METVSKKTNPITWMIRYVKEAKEELTKVTWPSKKETTKYVVIILILSLAIAAFFGGLDWLLTNGLKLLINLTS